MARGKHLWNTTFRIIRGNSCDRAVNLFEFQRQNPIRTMRRTFLGNLCCSARPLEWTCLVARAWSNLQDVWSLVDLPDSATRTWRISGLSLSGSPSRKARYYIVVQKPSFIRNHKVYGMEFKLNISNSLLLGPKTTTHSEHLRRKRSKSSFQMNLQLHFRTWFYEMERTPSTREGT